MTDDVCVILSRVQRDALLKHLDHDYLAGDALAAFYALKVECAFPAKVKKIRPVDKQKKIRRRR